MKTTKQQGAKAPARETSRLSVRVSTEAYQRLFVASVMGGSTASEILDRLIKDHCREWSLPGKIVARNAVHDRAIPSDNVIENTAPTPSQVAA